MCEITYNTPPAAKIHMKVKCHCNAPPSQPPIVIACGTASIRSCSGILDPKVGNASKILKPLSVRTVRAIALVQWHWRTTHGCSYAGRTVVGVGITSQPSVPAVALVAPVTALRRQDIGDCDRHHVLRLFVSELRRQLQSQRGAVPAIERPVVHLVAEQRLRLSRCRHVQPLVIVVCAGHRDESRARIGADEIEKIAEPRSAE